MAMYKALTLNYGKDAINLDLTSSLNPQWEKCEINQGKLYSQIVPG